MTLIVQSLDRFLWQLERFQGFACSIDTLFFAREIFAKTSGQQKLLSNRLETTDFRIRRLQSMAYHTVVCGYVEELHIRTSEAELVDPRLPQFAVK